MHPTQHLLLTAAYQRCSQAVRCCFQMQVTGPSARSRFLPHRLPSPFRALGAAGAEVGLIVEAATCCRSKQHSTPTTKPKSWLHNWAGACRHTWNGEGPLCLSASMRSLSSRFRVRSARASVPFRIGDTGMDLAVCSMKARVCHSPGETKVVPPLHKRTLRFTYCRRCTHVRHKL